MAQGKAIYKTPAEFEAKVEEYFNTVPIEKQTKAGLQVYTGLSMTSWSNYKNRPKYSDIVEFAETRLCMKWEEFLSEKGRAADMFALKQYGWSDKQEIDQKLEAGIRIVSSIPRPEKEKNG